MAVCSAAPDRSFGGRARYLPTPPAGPIASRRRTGRELEAGISSAMPASIGRAWDSKHVFTWAGLILRAWNSPVDPVYAKKLDYETKVNSILVLYLHHFLLIRGAFHSVFKKRRLWLQYNQTVISAGEPVDCKELTMLVWKVGDTWFGEPSVVNIVSSNSGPVPS